MDDITVTVEVRGHADAKSAAIKKASTWFGAMADGFLPDGRRLRVKRVGSPRALVVAGNGRVTSWKVAVSVGLA